MFIAIYRFLLKAGTEEQFRKDWLEVTKLARKKGRSLGSSLGRAQDGSWVAVARWPTKQTRDDWFSRNIQTAERARMREAVTREVRGP